jgi:hypothetical protein
VSDYAEEVVVRDAATAEAAQCRLCDAGFRRVNGIHIGSQRLGMIPDTPCDRIFVVLGDTAPNVRRPWVAYIDGKQFCSRLGAPRWFASAKTAYAAACAESPRKWHP